MKQWLLVLVCLFGLSTPAIRAQSPQTAIVRRALARAQTDTSRVLLLADLSATYRYSYFDSVMRYARRGLRLARKIGYPKGEGRCLSRIAILLSERGNLPQALRTNLQALRLHEESNDPEGRARTLNQIGLLYYALDDGRLSLHYFFRALRVYEGHHVGDDSQIVSVLTNIGTSYGLLHKPDSAALFLRRAYATTTHSRTIQQSCWGNPRPYLLRELGLLAALRGQDTTAMRYYRLSAQSAVPENDLRGRCRAYHYLAELYHQRRQTDSCVFYARRALAVGQQLPFIVGVVRTSKLLTEAFEDRQQRDSALKYMRIMVQAEDSLYNPQRIKQLDAIGFAEQQRLLALEESQEDLITRGRTLALLVGLGIFLVAALLMWRSYRLQKKINIRLLHLNEQVTQQTAELTHQRDNMGRTLQELKAAQSQLVLREKMASLGDLMAGVAQEVRRPVQLMREYAGISWQLCQELRGEITKCTPPVEEQEYLDEMIQNLVHYQEKISQVGQRAATIVSGMLEYAATQPSPRQLTDLNILAEDYLRLTYHDLRAKNRHLNVALRSVLDPTLQPVLVVRHELGRALVGLFTNALYAVQQRQQSSDDEFDYVPQILLTTRRLANQVEIRVRDNGAGIPPADLPNIFQRFFTTKPAGEGTGLGLSLSYDIVTRGHGGTLVASSEVGEYTELVVTLPLG